MNRRQRRAKAKELRHSRPRHTVRSVGTTTGVVAAAAITMGAVCTSASGATFNGSMVKDLYTAGQGSNSGQFTAVGSKSFFAAADPAFGRELWISDGTQAGTAMVKDINPGRSSSLYSYGSSSNLVTIGSTLYFGAEDGANGMELWKSDGTAAGTVMISDIRPGGSSSNPSNLTAVGSTLYFTASGENDGTELWKSDGTAAGTQLVKNINTEISSYGGNDSSRPLNLTAVGSKLYFTADDGTNGRELWKSDGSVVGTTMVEDITPGAYGSFASYSYSYSNFTSIGNTLYFAPDDGSNGRELWKSDGVTTELVKDIRTGTNDSNPSNLTAVGSTIYFSANDGTNGSELWKSDGTAGTTSLLKDINPGIYSASSNPAGFKAAGGTVYFSANDGTHDTELWKTDGTAGGTQLVKDIRPGGSYYGSGPQGIIAVGGTVYFSANDGSTGKELWKSNGTAGGTQIVKDINPGGYDSISSYGSGAIFSAAGGKLYFSAENGTTGPEPWVSDGSAAGTKLTKDIVTRNLSSSPNDLTDLNGTLFFRANGDNGSFWKSNGTAAGTVNADSIFSGSDASDPQDVTNVNGTLYFSARSSSTGRELWKSDGTAAGTRLIKDINTASSYYGPRSSNPSGFTAVGGVVYFSAADDTNGTELWKTDGTAAGTKLVKDVQAGTSYSGPRSSNPSGFTAVGGVVYFSAADDTNGTELWKSDGSAAGTQLVKDIRTGSDGPYAYSSNPKSLAAIGNTLFFSADDGVNGRELWKSSGSGAGTVMVKNLGGSYSGLSSSGISEFAVLGGKLYFAANDSELGNELWTSDGTANGTTIVKDITTGFGGSISTYSYYDSPGPTAIDGKLYFAADNGSTGSELWKSDGTSAGTTLVKDLIPGPEGSRPSGFTASGKKLFFSASDGAHGTEIWAADRDGKVIVPPPPPKKIDNRFNLPRTGKVNLKTGTVTVKIKLPGAGVMKASQVPAKKTKKKRTPILVRPARVKARKAGVVKVVLKPTKAGLKKLKKRGKKLKVRKFKVQLRFTYTPTGGKANTKKKSYTFKRR